MPNKVIISDAAYADLDETFSYIACGLNSPNAAQNLIDKVFDSIELLGEFPLIGFVPKNEVLKTRGYRLLPIDNYIVFYIPKDEKVHVIRIMYGRRDWETILLNEKQTENMPEK